MEGDFVKFIPDILILVVALVMIVIGVRSGFLKMLLSCVGYIAAAIGANIIAKKASPYVFEFLFKDKLIEKVGEKIDSAVNIGSLSESLNSGVIGMIIGKNPELSARIDALAAGGSQGIADTIVSDAVAPSIISLISIVIFALALVILIIIVKWLVKLCGFVNKIPIAGGVNRVLGVIFGLAIALAICFVISYAVQLINGVSAGTVDVENTIIFSKIHSINPLIATGGAA